MPLGIPEGGGEPVFENGSLVRAYPNPAIHVIWNGHRHWIGSWQVFVDIFGESAAGRVEDHPAAVVEGVPVGREIWSAQDWSEIQAGQTSAPPPLPDICTPVPAAQAEAEQIDAATFIRILSLEAEQESRDAMLQGVCDGAVVLTRDGTPIACREQWPGVARSYCDGYTEPALPPPIEADELDPLGLSPTLENYWWSLMFNAINGLRSTTQDNTNTAYAYWRIRSGN